MTTENECSACSSCPQEQPRKTARLTFKREELVYDASNYSFVEGELLPEVESEHLRHQVIDIAQEGNIDRVTRILNIAHAECVEMLYPYSKTEIPDDQEALNDILTEPEEYVIDLSVPADFSLTTLRLLEHAIHEYMVCRVLADWMSITKRDVEVNWEKKYTLLRDKIRSCLTSRLGRVRIKLQPF